MWLTGLDVSGSIASILTLPGLVVGYVNLSRKIRALRTPRGVSEHAVEFNDGSVAINLVPIAKLAFLPRRGDTVMLPGEHGESDAGAYEVTGVCHCYVEPTEVTGPCPAELLKVVAYVAKK